MTWLSSAQAGGERGDVIMLVHLDQATGEARMLSIPRDLWVDIPGNGEGKINAAYSYGGPSLMVQTIRENLGIDVNHYVEVDFLGFIAMVDELGGVEMSFPYPARDAKSGLSVEAGTQTLDGEQALAFARSRKYEEYQDDRWVSVDASDLGRTQRQQEVVRAILTELKIPGLDRRGGGHRRFYGEHMTIDATLADSSVASLAWDFRSLVTGSIDGQTLPVYGDTINGASVVRAAEPEAAATIDGFLSGVMTVESAPMRIQVLNGNGVAGRGLGDVREAGRVWFRGRRCWKRRGQGLRHHDDLGPRWEHGGGSNRRADRFRCSSDRYRR